MTHIHKAGQREAQQRGKAESTELRGGGDVLTRGKNKQSVKTMFGIGISMKAWHRVLRLSSVTLSHLRVSPAFSQRVHQHLSV